MLRLDASWQCRDSNHGRLPRQHPMRRTIRPATHWRRNSNQKFLLDWGVHHRKSSVTFLTRTAWAEIGKASCDVKHGSKRKPRHIPTRNPTTSEHTRPNNKSFTSNVRVRQTDVETSNRCSQGNMNHGRRLYQCGERRIGNRSPESWWTKHTRKLTALVVGDHIRRQNQVTLVVEGIGSNRKLFYFKWTISYIWVFLFPFLSYGTQHQTLFISSNLPSYLKERYNAEMHESVYKRKEGLGTSLVISGRYILTS